MSTTQRFICRNPAADPVDDLAQCQAAIRGASWWKRADLSEHWPLTTDEAVQLLAVAGEFDIDAEGLADLIGRGLLGAPGRGDAESLEWSACDVVAASGLLEARQQWRSTPSGHDPKKHGCQILLEQARAAGEVATITAGANGIGPRFDVRHLLALLLVAEAHEARAKIIALLKAVLEVDLGIIV